MTFSEDYSADWIEESVYLEDLEVAERVEGGYKADGVFVPDQWFPGYGGVNSGQMELCRMEDGRWVFTKPVSVNFGRAGKANVMAALMYDRLGIPSPDIGIEDDTIFIEHLGQLDNPLSVDDADAVERAAAGKALTGDHDIGGNIGVKNADECYVYDFDQAGGPIGEKVDGYLSDFIRDMGAKGSINIDMEDVNRRVNSMARGLDLDDYMAELESVLDENLPGSYGFNDLDLDTVRSNIEYARENDVVSGEVEDIMRKFSV